MIVVDASVVTKCLFPEDQSELALALLADCTGRGERVVAPHLLPVELTNVVRQRMRRQDLTHDEAVEALDRFFALPVEVRPRLDSSRQALHYRALALAEHYDL